MVNWVKTVQEKGERIILNHDRARNISGTASTTGTSTPGSVEGLLIYDKAKEVTELVRKMLEENTFMRGD